MLATNSRAFSLDSSGCASTSPTLGTQWSHDPSSFWAFLSYFVIFTPLSIVPTTWWLSCLSPFPPVSFTFTSPLSSVTMTSVVSSTSTR
ncbi:hypothetical protein GW17_00001919 [Ensete ventricosum]|nr:hypothetical protein GW17_00001919 [Ensete ventricosum]